MWKQGSKLIPDVKARNIWILILSKDTTELPFLFLFGWLEVYATSLFTYLFHTFISWTFILSYHHITVKLIVAMTGWVINQELPSMYTENSKVLTWQALFLARVSAVLGMSWFGFKNFFSRRSHEPQPSANLPHLESRTGEKTSRLRTGLMNQTKYKPVK